MAISHGGQNSAAFTTTNLRQHLEKHPTVKFAELKRDDDKHKAKPPPVASPRMPPGRHLSVSGMFERNQPFASDDAIAAEINHTVLEMLAVDDLPFTFINGVGF